MEPNLNDLVVPSGRGRDAMFWMEGHGFVARPNVPIRSSDFHLVFSDPFAYYLSTRLGLGSPFSLSKPLRRGSWFHVRAEMMGDSTELAAAKMAKLLHDRLSELRETCEMWGLNANSTDKLLELEVRHHKCAHGWYEAVKTVEMPPENLGGTYTLEQFLLKPNFQCLGKELLFVFQDPLYPNHPLVIMVDRLILDTTNNQLWAIDYKTCAETPSVRLAMAPIEFQTQLYLDVLRSCLHAGHLHRKFPTLPPHTTIGGMAHVAVQKPTIDFNKMKDRPFVEYAHILKSGPRKGQTEMRKEYDPSGEPSFDLYIERCKSWYHGTGEYEERYVDRRLDCPVNISLSPLNVVLDSDGTHEYHLRLQKIYHYASLPAVPAHFPRNPHSVKRYDDVTSFAPFYLCPPEDWPEICRRERIISLFREEQINHLTPSGIYDDAPGNPSNPDDPSPPA